MGDAVRLGEAREGRGGVVGEDGEGRGRAREESVGLRGGARRAGYAEAGGGEAAREPGVGARVEAPVSGRTRTLTWTMPGGQFDSGKCRDATGVGTGGHM